MTEQEARDDPLTPSDVAFHVFIQSAEERFTLDRDYRARVQKEAMHTDATRARMNAWHEKLANQRRTAA